MSQKVKVFNDNVHPLNEMFKGEKMSIAAKDYWREADGRIKVMDVFEANDYRGQYAPVPFDGSGKMIGDPRYFKMIKMEIVDGDITTSIPSHKCMAKECRFVGSTESELTQHLNSQHASIEKLVLPEQDAEISKKKAKVN